MSYAVLFVIVFVGGPLAFRALMRGVPSSAAFRQLALCTAICAGAGLSLRYGYADMWGRDPLMTGAAVAFIWGGWIGVLAYGAQADGPPDAHAPLDRRDGICGNNDAVVRSGQCQPVGCLRG